MMLTTEVLLSCLPCTLLNACSQFLNVADISGQQYSVNSVILWVIMSVCQSVSHMGSFGAAFAKSLWPLVIIRYNYVVQDCTVLLIK